MGKEGLDTNMYLIRPSHEAFRCHSFTFKKAFKEVLQFLEGESDEASRIIKGLRAIMFGRISNTPSR